MLEQEENNLGEQKPERKQPEYGELAPEGWGEETAGTAAETAPEQPSVPAVELPGIPHNLGVGASAGVPNDEQFSAATNRSDSSNESKAISYSPGGMPTSSKPSPGDRIFTIVLLVLGAFGALNLAGSALNVGTALEMVAAAAGLEGFELSPATTIVQSLAAVTVLSIFAAALLWSIHRMRRQKRSFWVPLLGGATAFVALFIFMFIALGINQELMTSVTPETVEEIFKNLNM